MRIVAAQELENWLASGKVLEKDARGPKVVALADGLFLKVFYTRRHPVLARLQPAAKRFAQNAERLRQLSIQSPEVQETFWLDPRAGLSACLYHPLPGHSIVQLYNQAPQQASALLPTLARFIWQLHQRGIYFRSLHLGNILQLPDNQYGLIDVLDLQFKRGALNRWQVQRNFQHLHHYLKRHKLQEFPLDELIEHYRGSA
ncbi:toluene tolerance protein [Ectopseudomonas mendocina]|nr:lipopolysaccharide kinase InaA family protein [Pseudomonas mendocina]TRO17620.1 toluene tolerance protein [Pseudomonas mendocina]TRO27174.1 toluene tolerance protein [Pseudomonas mendocina]